MLVEIGMPLRVMDAAAHAALPAVSRGGGVYNIAEDDGAVSSAKARRELGFDPEFRISERLAELLRAAASVLPR